MATCTRHSRNVDKHEHQGEYLRDRSLIVLAHSQYISLQILEKLVQTRWKALPADQQSGIRNFVVQATVETSSDETRMRREKGYLNKLNIVLVQVRYLEFH